MTVAPDRATIPTSRNVTPTTPATFASWVGPVTGSVLATVVETTDVGETSNDVLVVVSGTVVVELDVVVTGTVVVVDELVVVVELDVVVDELVVVTGTVVVVEEVVVVDGGTVVVVVEEVDVVVVGGTVVVVVEEVVVVVGGTAGSIPRERSWRPMLLWVTTPSRLHERSESDDRSPLNASSIVPAAM